MMNYQQRTNTLIEHLRQSHLAAVALIPGPSLFYFTGLTFHLMERPVIALISGEAEPRMVIPELEQAKSEKSPIRFELFSYGEHEGASLQALEKAVSGLNLDRREIGIEPLHMRFHELSLLQAALPSARFEHADGLITSQRIVKEQAEIDAMQRAAEIAEAALQTTLPQVKVGMSELELASELAMQLLRAGSEPEAKFGPIVASGPNAALPHAVPSERTLFAGDSLILDWGAIHQGYTSDITRTFFVKEIPEELGQVHEIVQMANTASRAAVKPGNSCGSIDKAARDEIEQAGYGKYFIHRTGHGLGLEAHEPPFIREGEEVALAAGMTFTVEPGIYLPDQGGVRVEDDVAVTKDGGVSMTTYPREAQVIA